MFLNFDTDDLIQDSCGIWRSITPLVKHPANPVLLPDKPWEREVYTYGSLVFDKRKYKLWYQVLNRGIQSPKLTTAIGYAESENLLDWHKPLLGVELDQVGPTNLIRLSSGRTDLCSPTVVRVQDRVWPYRMAFFDAVGDPELADVLGTPNKKLSGWGPVTGEGIFFAKSKDGIRWRENKFPLQFGPTDALSLTSLPSKHLLVTFKTSRESNRHFRVIGAAISEDLGKTWKRPRIILKPDLNDPPGTEFYGLTPFIMHGQLYGLLQVYHNSPDDKTLDVQLVRAADPQNPTGIWYRCLSRLPILTLGTRGQWDAARIYPGSPVVQDNGTIVLTYGGANTRHDDRRYIQRSIGIAVSNSPSFSKLESDHRGGWISLNRKYMKNIKKISLVSDKRNIQQLSVEQGSVRLTPERKNSDSSLPKWNNAFKTYRLLSSKQKKEEIVIKFLDRSVLYGIFLHDS